MTNIWFTSDTHFGHFNIIKYANRPFSSVEEMNEILITNWNTVVYPEDEVYHLGDFGFGHQKSLESILNRLNGKKYLIRGNHDKPIKNLYHYYFDWVKDYHRFFVAKQLIILCHYPIENWDGKYHKSWHCHGHSHGKTPSENLLRIDVGVDCHNYCPVNYEQVKKILNKKGE
jgi:calcineurin-like phosphoesterase family protein